MPKTKIEELELENKNETDQGVEIDIELKEKLSSEKHFSFGICKAAEIDEDERTVKAIISTDAIDRDGEMLDPKGMMYDNYVKNPVVPWCHQSGEPPIGKAIWLFQGRKKIEAKVKFAMTERAEEVWQLFKGKFLNAFSVGFLPKDGHRPTPKEIEKRPDLANCRFIFDKWELLEFSPVTVPANPQALAQAVKNKSLNLSSEIKQALDIEVIIEKEEKAETQIDVVIPVQEFKDKNKIEVEPIFSLDGI